MLVHCLAACARQGRYQQGVLLPAMPAAPHRRQAGQSGINLMRHPAPRLHSQARFS